MVSATKMRRAQEVALLSRPYAIEALRILRELSIRAGGYLPAIMMPRDPSTTLRADAKGIRKTALVLIVADRGLAGSFNTNVFRQFEKYITKNNGNPSTGSSASSGLAQGLSDRYIFISVGKKAEEFLNRKGVAIHKSFKGFGDYANPEEVQPLTSLLVSGFLKGEWDAATVISTHFRSTLRQDVMVREILPINGAKLMDVIKEVVPEYGRYSENNKNSSGSASFEANQNFEYLIEPDPKEVMDALAPELVEVVLYDFLLEANASEHSARMVAMKNASENAAELKEELTREYNKTRQAAITREISEIVGGAEALQT